MAHLPRKRLLELSLQGGVRRTWGDIYHDFLEVPHWRLRRQERLGGTLFKIA